MTTGEATEHEGNVTEAGTRDGWEEVSHVTTRAGRDAGQRDT